MKAPAVNHMLIICAALFASACSVQLRYPELPQTAVVRVPAISTNLSSETASMEITVLIYNVLGMPWPIGCGKKSRDTDDNGKRLPVACVRSTALKKIGDTLGELRQQGLEPDIILLQEAFITASTEIPDRGRYPNWVAGPGRKDLGDKYSERASAEFISERSFWKGEKSGKFMSSGLLLASNFAIMKLYNHPFNQWECGGIDCLANKGLLVAELQIPGLPDNLAVATTHYNARGQSGVSEARSLAAHNLQVAETTEFLRELNKERLPFIWGGDFNMRYADDRIRYFVRRSGGQLNEVSSFCVDPLTDCEVRIKWDTDTPWYETQDLQGWVSGSRVSVAPIKVEAIFDELVDGVMPSDHNGLLVHYRLTWTISE